MWNDVEQTAAGTFPPVGATEGGGVAFRGGFSAWCTINHSTPVILNHTTPPPPHVGVSVVILTELSQPRLRATERTRVPRAVRIRKKNKKPTNGRVGSATGQHQTGMASTSTKTMLPPGEVDGTRSDWMSLGNAVSCLWPRNGINVKIPIPAAL